MLNPKKEHRTEFFACGDPHRQISEDNIMSNQLCTINALRNRG